MTKPIAVIDALIEFGFLPDESATFGEGTVYAFHFLDFHLTAWLGTSKWFKPAVMFSGLRADARSISEFSFELPPYARSSEQVAAFLAYYLRNETDRDSLTFGGHPHWLIIGRENTHLLPWEQQRAAYDARPLCYVEREWFRLGLKTFEAIVADSDANSLIEFSFDGKILTIECDGRRIPMVATGNAWDKTFAIASSAIHSLPKRLKQGEVEVSVYEGVLTFGRYRYAGISEKLL